MNLQFNTGDKTIDDAIISFGLSAVATGVISGNPSTAIINGFIGAVASVISSVARRVFKPLFDTSEFTKEMALRSTILLVAEAIVTRKPTSLRLLASHVAMSGLSLLQGSKPNVFCNVVPSGAVA